MMHSFRHSLAAFVLVLGFAGPCSAQSTLVDPEESVIKTAVFTLGPTRIEHKKIFSMQGPTLKKYIILQNDPETFVVWLKSLKIETFNDEGPINTTEFICHARLEIEKRGQENSNPTDNISRYPLQSIGGGVTLPVGYGIPFDSLKSPTFLFVRSMNSNAAPAFNVRYRMTIKYIKNADAQKLGLKPIHSILLNILNKDSIMEDRPPTLQSKNPDAEDMEAMMQSHMAALRAKYPSAMADIQQCGNGTATSGNFMVPPGHHEYIRVLNRDNPLYKGGRIHAFIRHLHAYGESVDLIDQTTNRAVWPEPSPHVGYPASAKTNEFFSSLDGIPLDPSHTYAIKAVYNNTSDAPIDGMGAMALYVADEN